jgi:hypothetical protein
MRSTTTRRTALRLVGGTDAPNSGRPRVATSRPAPSANMQLALTAALEMQALLQKLLYHQDMMINALEKSVQQRGRA